MSVTNWSRSDNFINTATDGNYQKAKLIFDEHDAKMHAGIAVKQISDAYNFTHSAFEGYKTAYNTWSALRSSSAGNTRGVILLLDDLSGTKARHWDVDIQAVYDIDTITYKKLLPKRRKPYQRGAIEQRRIALSNLIAAIGSDAKLETVKKEVQAFLDLLNTALTTQQTSEKEINSAIKVLDAARIDAAKKMFRNYGSLIELYYETPKSIDTYFPIDLLTTKSQKTFTMTLESNEIHLAFKRKLDVTKTKLSIINYADEPIEAYYTNGLTNKPKDGEMPTIIAAQSRENYNPASLNYTDEKKHLYITYKGKSTAYLEIEII